MVILLSGLGANGSVRCNSVGFSRPAHKELLESTVMVFGSFASHFKLALRYVLPFSKATLIGVVAATFGLSILMPPVFILYIYYTSLH